MNEKNRIEIISSAIRSKKRIDTLSGNEWIMFRPYLLYRDVHNNIFYRYGYYDDSEISKEPKTFDLFRIDEVEIVDDLFVPNPFWKSHTSYQQLTKLQVESIEEIPFEI